MQLTERLREWRKCEAELLRVHAFRNNYKSGVHYNDKFQPDPTPEQAERLAVLEKAVNTAEHNAAEAFENLVRDTTNERELNKRGVYRCFCGDPIRMDERGAVWSLGGMYHKCPLAKAPNSFKES